MNQYSIDDTLTAALNVGAQGEAVDNRLLDAIRNGIADGRNHRPVRTTIGVAAALVIVLVVGVGTAALLTTRTAEDNPPDVVAAAVNLLEPPAPGTVRHVSVLASVAYPSFENPSTVKSESWERVTEDGSTVRAVIVHDEMGTIQARAVDIDGAMWSDLDGQLYPPDRPVAVPPQVIAGMSTLSMGTTEDFLGALRSQEGLNYSIERRGDAGNYVIVVDITSGIAVDEDGLLGDVEVERAILEIELSESLDRFVRREFFIITPASERFSFNRVEYSGWEDIDVSEVDPGVFSTEIPMTSPPTH